MPPISRACPLLLGSASPRRKDILEGLGIPLVVRPANTPETLFHEDTPQSYLERVVAEKLAAALAHNCAERVACVLVADTIVVLGEQILGKPTDREDAARLVGKLAGRTHRVLTRFAFAWEGPSGSEQRSVTVESSVTMRAASSTEIQRYADTGEGLDKAGAYAVQGLGAFLVRAITGSYTNVVGLPACELVQELTEVGLLREFPRVF